MDDYTFDLHRIVFGDVPTLFYVEIALRTVAMFLFALILIRLLGKRGLGQLSAFDFVIIIALGSAVGDPMFYDDVPLLHGMMVVTVVVVLERMLTVATMVSGRVESFVDSTPTVLVERGVIDEAARAGELISRRELFEALRNSQVNSLDDVEIAVLEPSGHLSVRARGGDDLDDEMWSFI